MIKVDFPALIQKAKEKGEFKFAKKRKFEKKRRNSQSHENSDKKHISPQEETTAGSSVQGVEVAKDKEWNTNNFQKQNSSMYEKQINVPDSEENTINEKQLEVYNQTYEDVVYSVINTVINHFKIEENQDKINEIFSILMNQSENENQSQNFVKEESSDDDMNVE